MGQTLNNALISERFGDDVRVFSVYAFMNNFGTTVGMGFALSYHSMPYLYYLIILITQIMANIGLTYLKEMIDEVNDKINVSTLDEKSQIVKHYESILVKAPSFMYSV
jgi:hypothetical protein